MKRHCVALAALLAVALPAGAGDPMPPELTFGYEEEGKVDASQAACEATVREVVEWEEAEIKRAVGEVCTARKRHVEAYAGLQKSYRLLAAQVSRDTRLDPARAVQGIQDMVKACIDHKTGLTTGGHNIVIDIIPNEIAARCLEIGKNLLDEEIAWLTRDLDKPAPRYAP